MKKVVFFIILIISLFIINNLVRSIYNLWQKQDLLVKANNQVLQEKKRNEQLKKQLTVVSEPGYIEQEARNKLLLRKTGEKIVLIPSVMPAHGSDKPALKKQAIWKEWISLFF